MTKPAQYYLSICMGLCLILLSITVQGQVDTMFWFAAPDMSDGHGDTPIYLRFSTLSEPANIVVSQPANPAFIPISVNVPANQSRTIDMTPWKNAVENLVPNIIADKGIMIKSTALVNAYYESAAHFNPEIFSLKGNKALGQDFLIPMQDMLPNGNYFPIPYSSFNIVATEDGTTVTINPEHNIVGHAAGQSFQIILNKGETYVARATTTLANGHLGGSVVTSDKPIAVTILDDSMAAGGVYGGCADLGGDQITPTKYLGKRYITVPGALNGPNDAVFIYPVKDDTEIFIDANSQGTLDRGQHMRAFSNGQPLIIETSRPVYVLHMSGFGCEVGLDQLPPVDPCNGSEILAVNRSSNQPFFLNILVYQGLTSGFRFNGSATVIQSGDFNMVPGSGGEWYYTNLQLPLNVLNVGGSAIISNIDGPFHLSVIHGGPGTGTMYGYFSDYGLIDIFPDLEVTCAGGIQLELDTSYVDYRWSTGDSSRTLNITRSGEYSVTVTNENGCVAADTIYVDVLPEARSEQVHIICPGDTLEVLGQGFHANRTFGEIILPSAAADGCDSIVGVSVGFYNKAEGSIQLSICEGDSLQIHGEWFHEDRLSGEIILKDASVYNCDSFVTVEMQLLPQTTGQLTETICLKEFRIVGNDTFDYLKPNGVVRLENINQFGCDSVVQVDLSFFPEAVGQIGLYACPGDTVFVEGEAFHPGRLTDTLRLPSRSHNGCDSTLMVDLEYYTPGQSLIEVAICPEDTFRLLDSIFFLGKQSGQIVLLGQDRNNCDSTVHVEVTVFPAAHEIITDTLCPGESRLIGNQQFDERNQSGIVKLEGASKHGCDSTIEVGLLFPQNALDIQDTFHLGYGQKLQLKPWYQNLFANWIWSPPDSLSCIDCERPWASPIENMSYHLKAVDEYGCEYTTDTRIFIQKVRRVFVPNAITVNGDRLNDGFTAFGNYFVERIEYMEIYNRWGSLIWRTEDIPMNDPNFGWDGTENGENVLPGVYAYRLGVRYLDGERKMFVGDVTVIR